MATAWWKFYDFAQRPQCADGGGSRTQQTGGNIQIRRLREHEERKVKKVAEQRRDAQSEPCARHPAQDDSDCDDQGNELEIVKHNAAVSVAQRLQ